MGEEDVIIYAARKQLQNMCTVYEISIVLHGTPPTCCQEVETGRHLYPYCDHGCDHSLMWSYAG